MCMQQWGMGSGFLTKQSSRHSFLSENQQKDPVEKIQISFLKHLIGVNSRSTNWAVLSETNSKPIPCKIIFKTVRYWERIKESISPILKTVLITNKNWKRRQTFMAHRNWHNARNIQGQWYEFYRKPWKFD